MRREERLTSEMKRYGVNKNLFDSNRPVTCPSCGNSFNLFYSRAKVCTGCPKSVTGCELARCVYCDTEFPLNNIMSKFDSRRTSNYLGSVVKRYYDIFGESEFR